MNAGEMARLERTLKMFSRTRPLTDSWKNMQLMASSDRNTITRV